jgi:cytochrome c553
MTRGLARIAIAAWAMAHMVAACADDGQDRAASAAKEQLCAACHAPSGKIPTARSPVLAGQSQAYLATQLKAFRDHSRADPDGRFFMWPMAASLSDPMIDRLAAHFAAQTPAAPVPGAAAAPAEGKALFEQGAPERGVAPCASCHGDKGQGVADFPRLAGQHADYLGAQLQAFADGSRPNPIMGAFAKSLSPADMRNVAAYLSSL